MMFPRLPVLGKSIVPSRTLGFVCSLWLRRLRRGILLQAFAFTRRLGPDFFGNVTWSFVAARLTRIRCDPRISQLRLRRARH